jgi:phosphohistidine phosphatase
MLTLSLLRHAKSSWASPDLGDFERPLNERGEAAAPRMGAYMARHGIAPELVLSSPSVRTRQTLDLVLPHLAHQPKVLFENALYLAPASTLLQRVRSVEADVRHVMLVGHDPGMHGLAVDLAETGKPDELDALRAKFPTAGLAVIVFDAKEWSEVRRGTGRLRLFITPKRLP